MVVHARKLMHLCVNCSISMHMQRAWPDADVNTFPSFYIFADSTCGACLNGGS